MSALAVREAERLADLEVTIAQGLTTFVEVGAALAEIRDARLYRETHATFEDYCRERWQMSRPRAYELIGAAQVVGNLSAVADTPTPTSERATRPLTKLEPEQQCAAWKEAVETAPGGKVTAAHVTATVRRLTAPEPEPATPEPKEVAPTPVKTTTPAPKVDTYLLERFVHAAINASTATDEQIDALSTNDLMMAELRRAEGLIPRILARHSRGASRAAQ